jgi:hypothetical protein
MNLSQPNSNPSAETLRVNIVDETDSGFYVVPNGGKLVRFIPRRFVNSIEFEAREKYF